MIRLGLKIRRTLEGFLHVDGFPSIAIFSGRWWDRVGLNPKREVFACQRQRSIAKSTFELGVQTRLERLLWSSSSSGFHLVTGGFHVPKGVNGRDALGRLDFFVGDLRNRVQGLYQRCLRDIDDGRISTRVHREDDKLESPLGRTSEYFFEHPTGLSLVSFGRSSFYRCKGCESWRKGVSHFPRLRLMLVFVSEEQLDRVRCEAFVEDGFQFVFCFDGRVMPLCFCEPAVNVSDVSSKQSIFGTFDSGVEFVLNRFHRRFS